MDWGLGAESLAPGGYGGVGAETLAAEQVSVNCHLITFRTRSEPFERTGSLTFKSQLKK